MSEDLTLARRAVAGDAAAVAEVDRRLVAEAGRVASSWRLPADEVRQRLRERVLLAAGPGQEPKLTLYDGSGPLSAWLRAVAVRLSSTMARDVGPELAVSTVPDAALAEPTPELALLRLEHRAHFRAAFSDALRELDAAERTVLRLHALDGVSLGSIGQMFQRDASSISRWLARIRAQLLEATRASLARRLSLEGSELESLMRLADSELTMSLSGLLRP
jgi:RNA polymerase sigma-70 factor (ECF subfamily)